MTSSTSIESAEHALWVAKLGAAKTLEDRFVLVLSRVKRDIGHGAWAFLEQETGIAAARWRKGYAAEQRPTPDMLMALGALFPQYVFWLVVGRLPDRNVRHSAP